MSANPTCPRGDGRQWALFIEDLGLVQLFCAGVCRFRLPVPTHRYVLLPHALAALTGKTFGCSVLCSASCGDFIVSNRGLIAACAQDIRTQARRVRD